MARKKRSYKKKEPFRESTLFVIVCEGAVTEPIYFKKIGGDSKKIKIEIVPPVNNKSAPKWLINNAALSVEKYELKEDDELWIVSDVDNWELAHIHELGKYCQETVQWNAAISNPCFEVWLYLHYADINTAALNSCKELKSKVSQIATGKKYPLEDVLTKINDAIVRAKKIDKNPTHFMPSIDTTKVYQLVEALLEKQNRI